MRPSDVKIRTEKYLDVVRARKVKRMTIPVSVKLSELNEWWAGESDAETLEKWSLGRGPLLFLPGVGWSCSEYLLYPIAVDFGDMIFDVEAANRGEHPWK